MTSAQSPTPSLEELFEREEFRSLPLRLAALLARGTASLADLRRAGPGTLVPLETQVGEPSWLIADGGVIGRGEIVELKGRLAFRVTKLGRPS